jgi:hypothetical protein
MTPKKIDWSLFLGIPVVTPSILYYSFIYKLSPRKSALQPTDPAWYTIDYLYLRKT